MAVAKRSGPDFLFLANANSKKFKDIENNKVTNLYFHNTSNQDWISITGETVTSSSDDPRIKEVWSKGAAVWFGDLGDGVHTSGPEDPRMKLIEVQAKCKFLIAWCVDVRRKWLTSGRYLVLETHDHGCAWIREGDRVGGYYWGCPCHWRAKADEGG